MIKLISNRFSKNSDMNWKDDIMNRFLDTNVIVGYCISLDPWAYYSKKALKKEGNHYWSTTVKNESIKVIFEIMDNYENLFYKIKGEMTD